MPSTQARRHTTPVMHSVPTFLHALSTPFAALCVRVCCRYEAVAAVEKQTCDDVNQARGDRMTKQAKKAKKATRDASYAPPPTWRTLMLPSEMVVLTESMRALHALLDSSALERMVASEATGGSSSTTSFSRERGAGGSTGPHRDAVSL